MTPEQFTEQIQQAVPAGLRSVVLYGSAAAGDHLGQRSDYNLLVVFDRLGMAELKVMTKPVQLWAKQGNHSPLLFTSETLREAGEVFPIELLDMRDAHKILFGDDVFAGLVINDANLRRQIEHELSGKLLQLQSQFLLTRLNPKLISQLLTASLSKFLILFRATARLYRKDVAARKLDALQTLTEHIKFDRAVFVTVQELKQGGKKLGQIEAEALFERYWRAIATVTNTVSELKKGTNQ